MFTFAASLHFIHVELFVLNLDQILRVVQNLGSHRLPSVLIVSPFALPCSYLHSTLLLAHGSPEMRMRQSDVVPGESGGEMGRI